jgi:hypothetical protein
MLFFEFFFHNSNHIHSGLKIKKERKNKDFLTVDENHEYEKLRNFYNEFKPFLDDWLTKVKIESKEHPYKKFSKKTNDKYYEEFVKLTKDYKSIDELKNN